VAQRAYPSGAFQAHYRRADGASAAPGHHVNTLGQPVGTPLPGWKPPPAPPREVLRGRWCTLEPLSAERHAAQLYAANALDAEGRNWTYLTSGPFERFEDYRHWVDRSVQADDPLFFAVVDRKSGEAVGVASYLRIAPASGCIEVGHINFSPRLQRTPAATEAMYLMMRHAFELGYRRYEWKCDALNAPSRAAARRLGFAFEGIFRKALVYRGRTRDTAWYAVTDDDWPALRAAFERWLAPDNFDAEGRQRARLSALTAGIAPSHG
jgi:RimJ/RimL family protein N-acetyltransferase